MYTNIALNACIIFANEFPTYFLVGYIERTTVICNQFIIHNFLPIKLFLSSNILQNRGTYILGFF